MSSKEDHYFFSDPIRVTGLLIFTEHMIQDEFKRITNLDNKNGQLKFRVDSTTLYQYRKRVH